MAITPSPIFQNAGSPDLFYKAQGSDSYTKIGGPSELQNLAKQGLIEVGKQYQQLPQQPTQPTPPVAPSANSSPTGTIQNPNIPAPGTMETTPGVFKASSLKSYYDNRAEILKTQYETANKDIQDIYSQVQSLKAPDYQSLYQQGYQQNVASIDENLNKTTQTLTSLDDNIRKLEDDVRGEVGGRAPESVIQAEVARRAKPLLLQRQTYVDQIQNLQGMRQNALQQVQQGLQFQQQSFEDQRGLLGTRLQLAQKSVDDFNVLLEKGAAASDKEIDNFRQNFSMLLESAPEVLSDLSQEEYSQLQGGFVPQTVMQKVATAIEKQKASEVPDYQSGIIGEYQFYVDQEKAAGRTPVSFNEYQTMDTNRKAVASQVVGANNMTPAQTQNFMTITGKYQNDSIVKGGSDAFAATQIADQVLKDPSNAANQLKSLYSLISALDPGTAVKEGEQQLALNIQSFTSRFGSYFDKIAKNQSIPPELAKEFALATKDLAGVWSEAAKRQEAKYSAQAQVVGVGQAWQQYTSLFNNSGNDQNGLTSTSPQQQITIKDIENDIGMSLNGEKKQKAQDVLNYYRSQGEEPSLEEIRSILGFNLPLSTGEKGSNAPMQNIGVLSSKYESGGDPGAIGYDNTGGYSYGTYQLAHNNAQKFIQQSKYASQFSGVPFNSPAWQNKWKEIAQKDPSGFEQAQKEYIKKTHFDPQLNKLTNAGIDLSKYSPVLLDVIWSTAVQHGAGSNIIFNAFKSLGAKAAEAQIIKKIYQDRWGGGSQFAKSTDNVKKAVFNRFFGPNGELKTALNALKNYA